MAGEGDFIPDGELDGGYYDDFELREGIGEQGIDNFAAEVGQAIGQQLAQQAAPSPQEAQQQEAHQQAVEAYAAEVAARHPALATPEGARAAVDLAQRVAQQMGRPELAGDLALVEAVHAATQAPPVDLRAAILGTAGGRLGGKVLPFGS